MLYWNPSKKARAFSTDLKTVMEALERIRPALPLRARPEGQRSVERGRYRSLSSPAALEIQAGKARTRRGARHASEVFVRFLNGTVVSAR